MLPLLLLAIIADELLNLGGHNFPVDQEFACLGERAILLLILNKVSHKSMESFQANQKLK